MEHYNISQIILTHSRQTKKCNAPIALRNYLRKVRVNNIEYGNTSNNKHNENKENKSYEIKNLTEHTNGVSSLYPPLQHVA